MGCLYFQISKLVWLVISAIVILLGRAAVEWISLNVFEFSEETSDSIAAGYVVIAVIVLIAILVQRLRR